jgi:hypothetical protein
MNINIVGYYVALKRMLLKTLVGWGLNSCPEAVLPAVQARRRESRDGAPDVFRLDNRRLEDPKPPYKDCSLPLKAPLQ